MEMAPSLYLDVLPSNHIRVVKVTSDLDQRSVTCTMTAEELSSRLVFSALSYTWQSALAYSPDDTSAVSSTSTVDIVCNGETCAVTENLFEALLQLGQKRAGKFIWIDAMSINQDPDDLTEKTQQVQLMGQIYSAAQEVIIWLGRSDERAESHKAVTLIRILGRLPSERRKLIRLEDLRADEALARSATNDFLDRQYWVALAKFFRRTWFTRAWIIQEVILAKQRTVWCGDSEINWRNLREVSGWLSQSEWKDHFVDPEFLGDVGPEPRLSAAAKIGGTDDDIKKMTQKSAAEHEHHDLFLDTLIRAREFDCENIRDKAYCCYGIGVRCWPQDFHFPKPDYSPEVTNGQAFTQTARAILEMSNNLHVLAYAESLRSASLMEETMPSWVPDWSVPDKVGLGVTGYRRFWAADNLLQRTEFVDREKLVLRIRGAQVGSITAVGNTKKDIQHGGDLGATVALLRFMPSQYPRLDQPARPEKMSGSESPDQSLEEAFWRTIIQNTGRGKNCPADETLSESFEHWMQARDGGRDIIEALRNAEPEHVGHQIITIDELKARDFGHSFSLRQCLRLFHLDNGLLGSGAEALEVGDSVWVVPGSRVPLILRKQEQARRYKLVGASYVHGLMHGQLLSKTPAVDFQSVIDLE